MNLYVKKLTLLILMLHFVTNITVQAVQTPQPLMLRPLTTTNPLTTGTAFLDSLHPLEPLSDDDDNFLATHDGFMQEQTEKRNQLQNKNRLVVNSAVEEHNKLALSLATTSQQLERGMHFTEETLEQMKQKFIAFLTAIRTKYDQLFVQGQAYRQRYQKNKAKIAELNQIETTLKEVINAYQKELQFAQVKDAARAFANLGQLEVKIQEQVQIFNKLIAQTPK